MYYIWRWLDFLWKFIYHCILLKLDLVFIIVNGVYTVLSLYQFLFAFIIPFVHVLFALCCLFGYVSNFHLFILLSKISSLLSFAFCVWITQWAVLFSVLVMSCISFVSLVVLPSFLYIRFNIWVFFCYFSRF